MNSNRLKKISIIVLYNIAAVILLFGLAEVVVRITLPQITPSGTDYNLMVDSLYYDSAGLKPNSSGYTNGAFIQVDQYGFRKTKIPVDTSKISWLLLGDSVTMGLGVESDSTFAAILQQKMQGVNILNPSLIGYSVKDYENLFKYFTEKRKELKIKKVIVFYCLNDIYSGEISQVEEPGGKVRKYFGGIIRQLRNKSRLYQFLKNLLTDRPKDYYLYDEQFYREGNPLLINTVNTFKRMNLESQKSGMEFIVILLPYEYQLRSSDPALNTPQKLMQEKLGQDSITVFNPFSGINISNSKDLYLYGDGIHFSNKGHRVVAEGVLSRLIEE